MPDGAVPSSVSLVPSSSSEIHVRTLPPSRSLPPKSLIVTFDDGHIGNYDLLPVLRAKKIPVTIFLCAGIIDTKRHFWFKHKPPSHRSSSLRQMPTASGWRLLEKTGFTQETEYETSPRR